MKYTVHIDNQEYQVEIRDLHARPIIVEIDGETFEVTPAASDPVMAAPAPSAVSTMAPSRSAPALTTPVRPTVSGALGGSSVRAPIPGVILTIHVKPGEAVVKGQELFVIEAM